MPGYVPVNVLGHCVAQWAIPVKQWQACLDSHSPKVQIQLSGLQKVHTLYQSVIGKQDTFHLIAHLLDLLGLVESFHLLSTFTV